MLTKERFFAHGFILKTALEPVPIAHYCANMHGTLVSEEFKELYKRRAGIEGTIAQAVRGKNMRYARYRGLLKTHLQHLGTAAAINLQRIAAWLMGDLPKGTRISPFAALVSPL